MVEQLNIPKLGVSMTEGTVIEWFVAVGDHVEIGAPLYLLESNKAQIEITSSVAGIVVSLASTDQTYPVGARVAEIRPDG